MKKRIVTVVISLCLLLSFTGCTNVDFNTNVDKSGSEQSSLKDENDRQEIDYSDEANWAYAGIGEDKAADLFLICPTVDTNDEFNMSMEDDATKKHFLGALNMERGIYEENTRMYAPYYRQGAMKIYSLSPKEREPYLQYAYDDISDAFRYYLENENDGRPIVLAGFSQGADMCYRLLEEFFEDEELSEQLVAVYAIGWPCTEEMVKDFPQIKPAKSEDDTQVVVSFECESEDVTDSFIVPEGTKAYTINPLNWKTDASPADKSLNLGACFTDYEGGIKQEIKELCGCYIDEERGTVRVTDIDAADYPAIIPGLPEGAYHIYDYQFFFRNLEENVGKRVEAFRKNESRQQITRDFKGLLDDDPELKMLMEKSIKLAAVNNPDKKTNPVRSLDDYYDFLDWSATCMPWNILDGQDNSDLYGSIDQSLDYFYYLLDQPLPELAGYGYYYPCLEYHEPIASWCKKYASEWGEYLSTDESWNDEYYELVCEDEAFGMKEGWYGDSNIWESFNDWFSRSLADESQRPVSDADIISPADSSPQGIWKIDEDSRIDTGVQLKSTEFHDVKKIIGEDSEYEDCFSNGILTHTFLDVNDYHRYHFPVSGEILEVRKIPALDAVGGVVAWSDEAGKYCLYDKNPGWQTIETRDCLIMDTEYGLVAILPIAMSQVSSCNWEESVKPGAAVEKGDPMGYFLFGGSDIVMIFQEGINLELTDEDHILMGEPYAEVISGDLSDHS